MFYESLAEIHFIAPESKLSFSSSFPIIPALSENGMPKSFKNFWALFGFKLQFSSFIAPTEIN